MTDAPSTSRHVALLVVTVVATLGLLAGAWTLGREASGAPHPSPTLRSVAVRTPSAGTAAPAEPTIGAVASGTATVVLTGAGDIADCASNGARMTSDRLLGQTGFFFSAGDNVEGGAAPDAFDSCFTPTWGRVLDRTLVSAMGEGDHVQPAFDRQLEVLGVRAAPAGVTWFSRDLGAWHVIVLDSDCSAVGGCGADSPEGRWLAEDLRLSSARCTLAIWHEPRFSSGEHGGDASVDTFWTMLARAKAELVVNGHDHDYERFAPQSADGRVERPGGIREIVVGTGGAALGQFARTAPNSEFRLAGTWGVLRLTLHPANYDWEFVPVSGEVADSGSTPCH